MASFAACFIVLKAIAYKLNCLNACPNEELLVLDPGSKSGIGVPDGAKAFFLSFVSFLSASFFSLMILSVSFLISTMRL